MKLKATILKTALCAALALSFTHAYEAEVEVFENGMEIEDTSENSELDRIINRSKSLYESITTEGAAMIEDGKSIAKKKSDEMLDYLCEKREKEKKEKEDKD